MSLLTYGERDVWKRFAKLATVLTLTIVCGGTEARAPDVEMPVILHAPFEITLAANPTTGFEWTADYDREYLSLKGKTYNRDASKPKDLVGVGGHTTFVFVPIKTGQTRIRLLYKRPWEPGASREVTYSIMVSPR